MTERPNDTLSSHAALLQRLARATGDQLSGVTVRCDSLSARICHAAGGAAVTVGDQILAHPLLSDLPESVRRDVLAHEVIHVLQNRRAAGEGSAARRVLSSDDDTAEHEARSLGPRLARGESVRVTAVPNAWCQCVTMDQLKTTMSASVYNEVAASVRRQTDPAVKQHALDFNYALADVYAELQTYVAAANPARGSLDTIANYFVERRRSKSTNLIDKDVKGIKDWMAEMKQAFANKGLADADKGRLFLAVARRNWAATQLRKLLDDASGSIGRGDASYPKIALWMYYFAFYHKGAIDTSTMRFNTDKTIATPRAGGGTRAIKLFQNRIEHIVGGHTFTHYVLDDTDVGNLNRAYNGIQTFYGIEANDLSIAADIEAALLNAAEVPPKVQNSDSSFFNVAAPYHLRMAFAFSGGGVGRVSTAFPSGVIAQPNAHRIPEKVLEAIYSLMAQGLGLTTLKQARQGIHN